MPDFDENEEIKDLLKRKVKLCKESHKVTELADVVYRLGYLHYNKGYYQEALEEFQYALELRKKLSVNADTANTYRYLGETLLKIGEDFARAKLELNMYYSIAIKLKDLVLIQQAHTTLGNYYLVLCEFKEHKQNRNVNLNEAYSHYLKSYDVLNDISDKRLVDSKEFNVMKARSCLNCAFVLDEKRDLIICNEYLKTAIEICDKNNFHEDLIRCYYIKCEQARRKNKMEEMLKTSDRIIEITKKSKDYIQQSLDFSFVADIYLKIQNFEKAKILLRQAYKLKKKCHISPEIIKKLKNVLKIVKSQKQISILNINFDNLNKELKADLDKSTEVSKIYEKLADSFCYIGLYEQGLQTYLKQLEISKIINSSSSELATIYSSLAQTYMDLNDFNHALEYFQLELNTNIMNPKSECISLLNIASMKEKLQVEFSELKQIFMKALDKAKGDSNIMLQLKVMLQLKEAESSYGSDSHETQKTINSLNEIKKIRNLVDDEMLSDEDSDKEEESDNESIVFSSESEDDDKLESIDNESTAQNKYYKTRINTTKKYTVKRNLRGETSLHTACIKGNFKLVKKLLEEGHPVNERDNLNWLPIHEACNYGHIEIVEALIKYGAKINDMMGPMPPLHDAAQNGHLEVVKLLLKAGALVYSFDHDGYTPLDQLCYFKETSMDSTTSSADIELFKECYEQMLRAIRNKDKLYKIKRVVSSDGNNVFDEKENNHDDNEIESNSSTRFKKSVNIGIDDYDSDNEEQSYGKSKIKQKRAISDYREAISRIGGKNSGTTSSTTGKKAFDRVIITESEQNISDDWLINDIAKKSNNKRKAYHRNDTESNDDDDNEKIGNDLSNLNFNELGDNTTKKPANKIKSPNSKKRYIDSSSDNDSNFPDISNCEMIQYSTENLHSDMYESEENLGCYEYDTQSYKNMGREIRKMNEEPVKIYNAWKKTESENDITIVSPFQSSKNLNRQNSAKSKTQLKLNKMQNFGVKKPSSKENIVNNNIMDVNEVEVAEIKPIEKIKEPVRQIEQMDFETKQSWKIKAIIDKKNFLIPVSNINATIDVLTTQITTRYKAIFKNDPTFREPDNVILKSSDDLILFGEDLIKDVLSDMCQVHLVIESCKNVPTLNELYEKNCQTNNLNCFSNVKMLLKESESNFTLELNSLFIDNVTMSSQFEVIFDSLSIISKQQSTLNNEYFSNLSKIDLASSMITDQTAVSFIEKVFVECFHLKVLNMGHNLLTSRSLKSLCDLASSNKMSARINSFQLEALILSGNDLAYATSTTDTFLLISNILTSFSMLKTLHLSDCKIFIVDSEFADSSNEISWKKMLKSIKTSKIVDIDFSYNKLSSKYFQDLIESFPDYQIETLSLSNSLNKKLNKLSNISFNLMGSFTKFISSNLVSVLFRGLGLNIEQTTNLIDHLCTCKKLKTLDLSYNSFSIDSITNLFNDCLKIEKAMLVNENNEIEDSSWSDVIRNKFTESSSVPLKHLELKINDPLARTEIKNCFKNEWQNKFVKILYHSITTFEIRVDY